MKVVLLAPETEKVDWSLAAVDYLVAIFGDVWKAIDLLPRARSGIKGAFQGTRPG